MSQKIESILKEQYTYVDTFYPYCVQSLNDLDRAFKDVPPISKPIVVYWRIKDKSIDILFNTDYISTIYDKEIAYDDFLGVYCCLFTIIVPSGSKVLPIKSEILLRRSKFIITKYTQRTSKSPFNFYDVIYVPKTSKMVTPNMSKEEQFKIFKDIQQEKINETETYISTMKEKKEINNILKKQYDYLKSISTNIKKSLIKYTTNISYNINRKLWENEPLTELEEKIKNDLDEEFKKIPSISQSIMVYRGINTDIMNYINNHGYISTSYDKQVSTWFKGTNCCILNIIVPTGSRILPLSLISKLLLESEILLPRESTFLLTNIRYSNSIKVYDLVYIPPNSQNMNIECTSNVIFSYF